MNSKRLSVLTIAGVLVLGGFAGTTIATRVGNMLWPTENPSTAVNLDEPATLPDLVAKSDMIVDAQIINVVRRGRFAGYDMKQGTIILMDDQSISEDIPPKIPPGEKIPIPETPPPPPPPGIPFTDVEVRLNYVYKGASKDSDTITLRLFGHVPLSDEGKLACQEVSFPLCVTDDHLLLLLVTMPDGTFGLRSRLRIAGEDLFTTDHNPKPFEMEGHVIKLQDVIQASKK